MEKKHEPCPLCKAAETAFFYEDKKRKYNHCSCCDLIFVPFSYHLNAIKERQEYDLHQNNPYDEGYRTFLERILHPVLAEVEPGSRGLDFGCGPGPALSLMFEERGHRVSLYDLYYYPETDVLEGQYDFITASEVVEHLAHPDKVFRQLWSLLSEGGVLGIMTKRAKGAPAFMTWHYKNDPTHICFYSDATAIWLAQTLGAELLFTGPDVFLLKKRKKI